ncbi:MAG: hypothetical protein JO108_27835 [Acidobacteriaceae bacterium]|nr:hypothetical protein [Acidobacteriaceae bacterium]
MKKFFCASVFALSLCSFAVYADEMTGYISDAHCGATHNKVSAANTACIKKCVGGGADPVLVQNGKVIKFDADSKDKAKTFVGQMVKIDGSMDGEMLKINSIDQAQ